jgi:hypothetical protein
MNDINNNADSKNSPFRGQGGDWRVDSLLRPNIANLKPYSSARDEFSGSASVFLDANENPYDTGYNRYPDPYQQDVKNELPKSKAFNPSKFSWAMAATSPSTCCTVRFATRASITRLLLNRRTECTLFRPTSTTSKFAKCY